jgi:NADH-quinone oxidoreductase subunit M
VVVTLLLAVPAAVGLWLVTGGRAVAVGAARVVTAGAAAVTLVLAVATALTSSEVDKPWVPELGLRLAFGVDGIAVPLVLLTALVGVLVAAHAWVDVPEGGTPATFLGCLLLVEAGALATFTARDAVLFFLAFELVLVPMWLLIGRYGDRHDPRARADASQRFVLYTAVGSTLMLVGILALVTSAGTSDLGALANGAGAALPADRQLLVALLLTVGLAVKVPVFPVHTWLPPAHTTAPTAGSVLLAAVLLKMGTYGLVRLPVASVPDGFAGPSASSGVGSSASSSATSSGSSRTRRSRTWASSSSRSRPARRPGSRRHSSRTSPTASCRPCSSSSSAG